MNNIRVGIELAGSQAADRARALYLVAELRKNGFINADFIENATEVDFLITRKRDFSKKYHNKYKIFDVSDAIICPPKSNSYLKRVYQKYYINRKILNYIKQFNAIIVGSQAQKEVFQKYIKNIFIIPDVSYYDEHLVTNLKPNPKDGVVFVWDGQGHNFPYLEKIIQKNLKFFRLDDVKIKIITDKFDYKRGVDNYQKIKSYSINSIFIEWDPTSFIAHVNSGHIGLAPVDLTCPFASAKPDNKMVNYQGLCLPAIASATKAYSDFSENSGGGVIVCRTDEDWGNALECWRNKKHKALECGLKGREYVLKNYSAETLGKRWSQIIMNIANDE